MKLLTLFFILGISFKTLAQPQTHTFDLAPYNDIKHFKKLPFDSVVIFDNRFDDRVAVSGNGSTAITVSKLNAPEESVSALVKEASKHAKKEHRTLFICIKQMRSASENPVQFLFWVEGYVPVEGGYRRIASAEKCITFGKKLNDEYYRMAIRKGFEHFLDLTENKSLKDTITYDLPFLKQNITAEWNGIPILTTDTFPSSGYYLSFMHFRQNDFKSANFKMEMLADSSYIMVRPDKKHALYVPENVYAATYQGQLYIRIIGRYFLPLNRINGLLTFKIPETIPGMNVIYGLRPFQGSETIPTASNVGESIGYVVAVGIDNIQRKHMEKTYKAAKQASIKDGSIIEMRDCYVDLNTGDIIYR